MVGLAASRGASSSVAVEDGQPAPPVVHLTLDDALERSRARSSRLASLGALSRAAAEGVKGARAGRRPELDVSAGYTRNSDVPELTLASPGSAPNTLFPNLPNNWRTRVAATMPLYTGGRVEGQIEGAAEAERASVSDRAAFENDLTLETHAAYVNVLFALENARVLKNAITSYEAHLKDVRARQDLGLAASSEVLSVTVERERAELGRIQSENLAAIAIANLRRLVGLPGGTALELDAPPETGGEARDEVEALVRQALESRPELEALRARIRAAGASARIAHAAKLPQAGLQAGYDYANPNPRILPQSADWKTSWSVGVNVSWRVLDGGRADTSAAQSQAQADALRSQLADLEERIRLEVTTRRLEVNSALAARAVTRRGIEAARDAVRITRDRYQEGVTLSSDLLDAETRLLRAELEATQTEALIQLARASLTRSTAR